MNVSLTEHCNPSSANKPPSVVSDSHPLSRRRDLAFTSRPPPTCLRSARIPQARVGCPRPHTQAVDRRTGGANPGGRLGRMEPPPASRLFPFPRRAGGRARAGSGEAARGQRRRRCPGPGAAERARRARPAAALARHSPRSRTREAPAARGRGDRTREGKGRPRVAPAGIPAPCGPRAPPLRTREAGSRGRPQPEGIAGDRAVLAQTPAPGDLERGLERRRARCTVP
ncbi:collagen alpha-1(I) chain-like [Ovis aries]|uniref:collagen alpha-1(I) chain-like n=1 Tax=Ovis aries TaxID=9940 RepID=UPI0029526C58|nr:collagen alpha-1(I) chain-like [Ovis aries]